MRIIQIITGIISLFFGLFAVLIMVFFPLAGIYFDYNSHGSSMEPALTNAVDIRISPKWTPFDELQIGDIIVFRQEDYPEDRPPGKVYALAWDKDHTKFQLVPEVEPEETKKYILIRHRIIAINENSLVTKGDNNELRDLQTVQPENYQGKIVWHMNHINWLFKAMYQGGLLIGCTILFFVSSLLLQSAEKEDTFL